MKILVYDTAVTGHHSEYIGHLVDYLSRFPPGDKHYFFVVNPKFATLFPEIHEKGKLLDGMEWVPVEAAELERVEKGNSVLGSLRSMKVMCRYAKRFKVDHVVALDFHTIKYGAIFKSLPFGLSSILFLQFYRLKRESFKEKIEFYKRYYTTKWCVRNPKVGKVFVLNDQETVDYMNDAFRTNCFQMLPDPIPRLEPMANFDIYGHYKIESHRKIYLHIGALGMRKGTDEVIDAAKYIDGVTQRDVAVLLVGRAGNDDDVALYQKKIKEAVKTTEVQVLWDRQFVPVHMMKSLFDQCHAVLLPYKNAEFSSGILGHAAAANKPVIATNAGLIKALVLEYGLGALLDVPDARHLALAISDLLAYKVGKKGAMKFVKEHDPEIFSRLVLEPNS